MEPNGLADRDREAKIGRWTMYISGFFLASFFLAPMTLSPGTVVEIEGRANAIDFYSIDGWGSYGNEVTAADDDGHGHFAWSELNPYAAFIYAFGDLNCHQKHERSWEVNGNQMPVCVRDIGIFGGLFLGAMVFTRRGWNRWTVKDTCLSLIPDVYLVKTYQQNRRTLVWIACGTLLCLPLIADGFLQLLTSYESTNIKRILTGIPFGLGLGILVCSMFAARAEAFVGAGKVLLPGDAKFTLAGTKSAQESE